jgi:hypothetical protein
MNKALHQTPQTTKVQAHRRLRIGVFVVLAFVGSLKVAGVISAAPAYPVKKGPTGRYLVDQKGVPFLIAGESPQAMIGNLSEADAELFFQNRRAHGFNTVWINLLCASGTACRADGKTFDGIDEVFTQLRYAGRVIEKRVRTSAEGSFPPQILLHASVNTDRQAHYSVKGRSCEVAVDYEWVNAALVPR